MMSFALKKFLLPMHFSTSVAGFAGVTLLKAISGLLIIKLLTNYLGPDAFGQLGQLMAMVGIIGTVAGGGITSALIQNLAGASSLVERQRRLTAAVKIYVMVGLCLTLALVLGRRSLSMALLNREDLGWVFLLLAATQWLVGANNLLQAVLSAMQRVRLILAINGLGTLTGTVWFVLLIRHGLYSSAAIAIVIYPAMVALVGCVFGVFALPADWRKPIWRTTSDDMKRLLSYSLVMLVSVSAMPLMQLVVRDMVGESTGWSYVGYWQALLKLSDVYMSFMLMLLIYYALPRFSAQTTMEGLDREFEAFQLPVFIFMVVGLAAIYLLRDIAIRLLFGADFLPMRDYFLPQMIGDVMRLVGLTYIYYALSRGARLMPILSDVLQAGCLLLFSMLLLPRLGDTAPVHAYMLSSMVSLVAMFAMHLRLQKRLVHMPAHEPPPRVLLSD